MIELANDEMEFSRTLRDIETLSKSVSKQLDVIIKSLSDSMEYYRNMALDLVCEKMVLEGLCSGCCEMTDASYCNEACEMVDRG